MDAASALRGMKDMKRKGAAQSPLRIFRRCDRGRWVAIHCFAFYDAGRALDFSCMMKVKLHRMAGDALASSAPIQPALSNQPRRLSQKPGGRHLWRGRKAGDYSRGAQHWPTLQ